MIEINHLVINNIPVLEVVDAELKNKCLPIVTFYHGWTNYKESVLVNGYELAKRGIRAILPEALYHGERKDDKETEEHYFDFWEIVYANVTEFPTLMDYFIKNNLADKEKMGVTGLSMGGITTCCLMEKYDNIKAASCLMGSPRPYGFAKFLLDNKTPEGFEVNGEHLAQLDELKKIDLSENPEKINGRDFHFWHGTSDTVVPYDPTFAFYNKYKDTEFGKNMRFTTTDHEHKVPYPISVEMVEFFAEVL